MRDIGLVRWILFPAAVAALLAAAFASAALTGPTEVRDPTGVTIVGPATQAGPVDEALATAASEAWDFASVHPNEVGYPWLDRTRGELVLSAVSPAGEVLLRQWVPINGAAAAAPRRIRVVQHSWGTLEDIKHGATFLVQAGVPDADAIYETVPDAEHNRVIITINRRSDTLLAALSARYGSDTFAVRIDSSKPLGMPVVFGPAEARYAPVALVLALLVAAGLLLRFSSRGSRVTPLTGSQSDTTGKLRVH